MIQRKVLEEFYKRVNAKQESSSRDIKFFQRRDEGGREGDRFKKLRTNSIMLIGDSSGLTR